MDELKLWEWLRDSYKVSYVQTYHISLVATMIIVLIETSGSFGFVTFTCWRIEIGEKKWLAGRIFLSQEK